jgi:hypothetical protein
VVALCRQAAVDRARADRHQVLQLRAELAQHMHVLRVAHAALDRADVAGPQCLMSVSGERSNSTRSSSSNSRSSMSSSDMWQPKQPASEVVAMRSFGRALILVLHRHRLMGLPS